MSLFFLLFSLQALYSATPPPQSIAHLLSCRETEGLVQILRLSDGAVLGSFSSLSECEETRGAAHGGVACIWFTPEMPVGKGGWNEAGWRPMNVHTKIGLGRKPLSTRAECLDATRNANGGVVCTNTGLGAKAANIATNLWCGASSQLKYCLLASRHASKQVVCSFPGSGTGVEASWVRTALVGECDYQSAQMTLEECNKTIPLSKNDPSLYN
jgi:hypothetical protein